MAVRIRLARQHLTRNSPTYHLVATRSSSRPSSKPLEFLGSYRPLPTLSTPLSISPNGQPRSSLEWGPPPQGDSRLAVGEKKVEWNQERLKYWLSVGAKPSKTVERLLNQAGIIQSNPIPLPTTTTTTSSSSSTRNSSNKLVMSRDRRIRQAVRSAEKEENW